MLSRAALYNSCTDGKWLSSPGRNLPSAPTRISFGSSWGSAFGAGSTSSNGAPAIEAAYASYAHVDLSAPAGVRNGACQEQTRRSLQVSSQRERNRQRPSTFKSDGSSCTYTSEAPTEEQNALTSATASSTTAMCSMAPPHRSRSELRSASTAARSFERRRGDSRATSRCSKTKQQAAPPGASAAAARPGWSLTRRSPARNQTTADPRALGRGGSGCSGEPCKSPLPSAVATMAGLRICRRRRLRRASVAEAAPLVRPIATALAGDADGGVAGADAAADAARGGLLAGAGVRIGSRVARGRRSMPIDFPTTPLSALRAPADAGAGGTSEAILAPRCPPLKLA
mmetsp:Transcript_62625/g.183150  ORF Transcript_62625/g.183150 Transcript_62625/m.183150 type:complete len:342 (+) Transcript_62625:1580-2605(+)